MNLPTPLTKENAFDELKAKYPLSMKVFCDWIDEYKEAVNWDLLFQADDPQEEGQAQSFPAPKFHALPEAMQRGIFIEFLRQQGTEQYLIEFSSDLAKDMDTYFCAVLEPHLSKQ